MYKFIAILLTSVLFCSPFFFIRTKVTAIESISLGILGDSNSDEYRANDNRAAGTQYEVTTLNWAELLVKKRNVNIGPWGTWGEPRRSGYKYNWARSGATPASMISTGQLTGLAEQVRNGEIQYVIISIGSNDFHSWNGTYNEVYNNILNDAQVQQKVNSIIANITLAVDTLQSAGNVKIVVTNYPDPALSVDFLNQFPDAQKRLRVTNAIQKINQGLITMTASRHIVLGDMSSLATSILSLVDLTGNITIEGEKIMLTPHGDEPHHLQLGDSVGHAGTVLNGFIANLFITSFLNGYGVNIGTFTNHEILLHAGIVSKTPATSPVQTKPGDGNNDGKVNGSDYILWLKNYSTNATGPSVGDFNSSGRVDGADYILWLNNYNR